MLRPSHRERDMLRRFSHWSLCSHSLSIPQLHSATAPQPRSPSVRPPHSDGWRHASHAQRGRARAHTGTATPVLRGVKNCALTNIRDPYGCNGRRSPATRAAATAVGWCASLATTSTPRHVWTIIPRAIFVSMNPPLAHAKERKSAASHAFMDDQEPFRTVCIPAHASFIHTISSSPHCRAHCRARITIIADSPPPPGSMETPGSAPAQTDPSTAQASRQTSGRPSHPHWPPQAPRPRPSEAGGGQNRTKPSGQQLDRATPKQGLARGQAAG